MSEKRQIPDGEPISPSEFTLGERYGAEEMFRDMGIERPPVPDIPWGDGEVEWTVTVGDDG